MRHQRNLADEEFNFWPVYGDLSLSMILILFLFLLSQFILNSRLLIAEDTARLRVERMQALVKQELEGTDGIMTIEENGNLQVITLSADFLFRSDQAVLRVEGEALLERMGGVFLETQDRFTRLAVEGHADFQSSMSFFRPGDLDSDHGNWRLSAERAIRVVQLLQGRGIGGEKLEAVGRSSYEPVDTTYLHLNPVTPGDSVEFRESLENNRRILIRIFYSELEPPAPVPSAGPVGSVGG